MDANSHFQPHDLLNILSHLLNQCEASEAWSQEQIDQTAYELAENAATFASLTGMMGPLPDSTGKLLSDAASFSGSSFQRALRLLESARTNSPRMLVPAERMETLELIAKILSILLHGVTEEPGEHGVNEVIGVASYGIQCGLISNRVH
ncbi:hypothetical protein [Aquimonas sp.]|jgi:hypothetical protein|uniref:hypothetical protein n=1 Tax=Aquimonas sp. TaxID=1872588 RepID=UPI0037BF9229